MRSVHSLAERLGGEGLSRQCAHPQSSPARTRLGRRCVQSGYRVRMLLHVSSQARKSCASARARFVAAETPHPEEPRTARRLEEWPTTMLLPTPPTARRSPDRTRRRRTVACGRPNALIRKPSTATDRTDRKNRGSFYSVGPRAPISAHHYLLRCSPEASGSLIRCFGLPDPLIKFPDLVQKFPVNFPCYRGDRHHTQGKKIVAGQRLALRSASDAPDFLEISGNSPHHVRTSARTPPLRCRSSRCGRCGSSRVRNGRRSTGRP